MLRQVAEGVLVHQSEILLNNTVVVHGRSGVLLIDPIITDSEMTCLGGDVRESGQSVATGFSTHPDWDHALWHAELGQAPRYGTDRCAAYMRDVRSKADWQAVPLRAYHRRSPTRYRWTCAGLITGLPAGTEHLPWDGPDVRIIDTQRMRRVMPRC
jgi:glyoxylase-like metal-dependent hydrolase (beta-lactamase superfamily II)